MGVFFGRTGKTPPQVGSIPPIHEDQKQQSGNFNIQLTLVIIIRLWQNKSMPRWAQIVLLTTLGIALGLVYGWVIDPVEFTDVTPDVLRSDYQTDYVLMVAEAYHSEQDPTLASRRLAVLGSKPPVTLVDKAYAYALQANYRSDDLNLIQNLDLALQVWQPTSQTDQP